VFLYGGNTIDAQLGDSWYLDVAAPAWQQVSADAEQAKAWHQTNFVRTQEVGPPFCSACRPPGISQTPTRPALANCCLSVITWLSQGLLLHYGSQ